MSHLVTPTSFRTGKTQPWFNNVLLNNKRTLINSDLTKTRAFEKIAHSLLLRKRLYAVKTNIADKHVGRIHYRLLFVPRVKIKPREQTIGNFLRKSLLKPVNLSNSDNFKRYVDLRKDKSAKIRRNKKPKKLNKWLSRRMFRGAGRSILLGKNTINDFFKPRTTNNAFLNAGFNRNAISAYPIKKHQYRTVFKTYYKKIHRRQLWKFDHVPLRRFAHRHFSNTVAKITNQPLKISSQNLFAYLVQKSILNYKTHQSHFWNYRYRKYRFQYKNYYDIVNSLLFISIVDNTETFFLSILKITLPLILKIRKFFRFLSMVIKYLPEIENKFSVFKLSIAGKLAGGTKRTKFHSIGYGVLPIQSLASNAFNNILAYTHIYGEFGLKLIMCKYNYSMSSRGLLF